MNSPRSQSLLKRIVFSIAMLIIAAPVVPLFAQQTPPPSQEKKTAEEEKKPKVTEEVTVTARKREETVQEVPMSVAAPTESELRDRGAENIEDVAANVAGFTVQNLGPGQSQVAIRGVSSGQIARDQPGVKEQAGFYLDESVISLSLFTPDLDLFDLSRVEVLRGPQGTLFGSGSESGTIRYITNQPKLSTSESVGEFTLDSVSNGGVGGSAKFATNVPMGSSAATRITAYYTRYGGYIDAVQPNLSINKDVNHGYRAGARAAFLFKPNENFSITPRIVYQKIDIKGWNRIDVFNILGNPYTTARPKVELGDRRQFTQIEEPTTDSFLLTDVNVSYKLPNGATFTSISSWTNRHVDVLRDAGALTASITGGSIGLPENVYTLDSPLDDFTRARAATEELRLAGTATRLQWLVGGFYANTRRNYGQQLLVSGFTALSKIPTASVIAPTDGLFWSDLRYKFRQSALFGEATYSATDKIDLTGGLRWYDFNERRSQIFDGIFGEGDDGKPQIQPGSTKANGIVPRVIAAYKVSDASRLYAQVSKGFRLGGINDPLNVSLCTPADLVTFGGHTSWEDETLWNYEVGSKSRIMNNRGTFNVAAFYADIKNLQATVTAGSCSSRVVFNVPKARSAGAEIELSLAPTDAFDFSISASHSNSKLRSTLTSTDPKGVVSIVAGIRSGARMPTVPQDQAAAAATYRWPTQSFVGYLTGVYQHIGDRFTQVGDEDLPGVQSLTTFAPHNIGGPYTQNTVTFDPKMPAYDILNLRFGILKGRFDTALFVNNVTDEKAFLALDRERGLRARISYLTNQPRTLGISTRVNF
ncbi:MAG TPA: TonB-dependent receptor [Thermoanaerobaculia bacterium]|jgi:iron complex outermembrane receptor protein|nr:TonB-dependent receptor [Thermoanaerobaculia bacterium]